MKNQNKKTTHHIIPISRLKGKQIVSVCNVPAKQHELYHHLFGNMCPDEIVLFLNETFWKESYEIVISRK